MFKLDKFYFKIIWILFFIGLPINSLAGISVEKDSIIFNQRNFEEKFQDKYNGNEFQYEPKEVKASDSLWDRFWRAVSRFFENLFSTTDGEAAANGISIFMKILAFAVIAFVVYLIVKIILNKEGGWIFSKSSRKIDVTENVEENIHTIDFNSIVTSATREKNYRVAVRYYYLWLLKSLSDKNIIEWDIEKTNLDYQREIQNTEIKKNFRFLSYVYEYSWYGEFELTEDDFRKAENAFLTTIGKK